MFTSLTTRTQRQMCDDEYLAELVQEYLVELRQNNLISKGTMTETSKAVGQNKKLLSKVYKRLGIREFEENRKQFFERPMKKDMISML